MTWYLIQIGYQIFVKDYGFLFFPKNVGKNRSKNGSGKCSQNPLDNSKQSRTDEIKTTLKKATQVTIDLIRNKIDVKTTKVSKIKISVETVKNEHDK